MDVHSERRVVTCLFIDVVGSTDLMIRVGPEVMRRRLADAFGQMSATIAAHGGTVESYVGDAIFALFGAPTAHIDDPERVHTQQHVLGLRAMVEFGSGSWQELLQTTLLWRISSGPIRTSHSVSSAVRRWGTAPLAA